jgi:hypothetical protein
VTGYLKSTSFGQLEQEKYHRIMPLLGNPTSLTYPSNEYLNCPEIVTFEVFTAMSMQGTVFWDLAPCIFG